MTRIEHDEPARQRPLLSGRHDRSGGAPGGSGPTGAAPKIFIQDSLTNWNGTLTNRGTLALIFGTLSNGMNLMGVNSNWQLIVTGQILLGASMLDALSSRER